MAERTPYFGPEGDTSGGRQPYLGPTGPRRKKKKGGPNVVERFAHDVKEIALNAPGGVIHAGKSIAKDVDEALPRGPLERGKRKHGDLDFDRTRTLAAESVRAIAEDFRHPLRHPGYTLLDILSLGSLGAGLAARTAAVSRGGLRAGLRGPKPGTRVLREGGAAVPLDYSRSALRRGGQKVRDALHERYPESRVIGLGRTRKGRVAYQVRRNERINEALERRHSAELLRLSRKLSDPQQEAIRIVAEEVPIEERIAYHREKAAGAGDDARLRRNHERQSALLEAAQPYVRTVEGVPRLTKDLAHVYEKAKRVARHREKRLTDLGLLSEYTARNRESKPGAVYRGEAEQRRRYVESEGTSTRARTEAEAGARLAELNKRWEDLVAKAEKSYPVVPSEMPYWHRRNRKAQRKGVTIATPAEQRRRWVEAKLEETLRANPDEPWAKTARAELDEAAGLKEELDRVRESRAFGEDDAPGEFGELRVKGFDPALVPEVFAGGDFRVPYTNRRRRRALFTPPRVGAQGTVGVPQTPGSLAHSFEGRIIESGESKPGAVRQIAESDLESERFIGALRIRNLAIEFGKDIPNDGDIPIRPDALKNRPWPPAVRQIIEKEQQGVRLTHAEQAALDAQESSLLHALLDVDEPGPTPGVKWIDPTLLARFNEPNPLVGLTQTVGGRRFFSGVDAITNASRAVVLYLRPAYGVPNILGNLSLNVIHQGFFAPANLTRAVRLEHKAGADVSSAVDELMGAGEMQSVAIDMGLGNRAIQKLAAGWSRVVDRPFRRAAFLHEARLKGAKTPEQLRDLIENEARRSDLNEVVRRATAAIIDYERMGPVERNIIRRLVFFYPWLKGSAVYTGHFVGEHPQQAAAAAQLARQAAEEADERIGERPSYWQGIVPAGNNRFINPAAVGLFGSTASLVGAAQGLVSGEPERAYEPQSFGTPAVELASNVLQGRPERIPDLWERTPQYLLAQRLRGRDPGVIAPIDNKRDALLQIIFGGLAPREYDRRKMRRAAQRER